MKHIAFITSTIAPSQHAFELQVTDPTQRLLQYKTAFSKYLEDLEKGIFDAIVYVDNSGYPLNELKKIVEHRGLTDHVEFISYKSDIDVKNKGRFVLELHLINYGMAHSLTLNSHSDCMIWKITGRYLINNVDKIVTTSKNKHFDMCINFRNYPHKIVDFYLVAFTPQTYRQLFFHQTSDYESDKNGETALREKLNSLPAKKYSLLKRLPYTPHIIGQRGLDGAMYGKGKGRIKYRIRQFFATFLPFIWV